MPLAQNEANINADFSNLQQISHRKPIVSFMLSCIHMVLLLLLLFFCSHQIENFFLQLIKLLTLHISFILIFNNKKKKKLVVSLF